MNKDTVWIISSTDRALSQPILSYIEQQAKEFAILTNGKLNAYLERTSTPWSTFLRELAAASRITTRSNKRSSVQDASDFYRKYTYEFFIADEIHNYELSLFQITCNDLLPAFVTIDSDIAEEEDMDKELSIESLEEFKDVFISIVQSNKVVYIISKLLSLSDPDSLETT